MHMRILLFFPRQEYFYLLSFYVLFIHTFFELLWTWIWILENVLIACIQICEPLLCTVMAACGRRPMGPYSNIWIITFRLQFWWQINSQILHKILFWPLFVRKRIMKRRKERIRRFVGHAFCHVYWFRLDSLVRI